MRSVALPTVLAAAVCFAGCTKAKMTRESSGLVLEGTAGAPKPLKGKIRIGSDLNGYGLNQTTKSNAL